MKDIDLFLPRVLRHAPTCPEPRAVAAIREAAQYVCERTKIWRVTDEVTITTPEAQPLTTVEDAAIERIEWARFGETDLEPVTVDWLDENVPGWQTDEEEAPPIYITQLAPQSVTLVPRSTGTLNVRYILKPSEGATTLPDALWDLHASLICNGAAASVLADSAQAYANPALAGALGASFTAGVDRLAMLAAKGQQRGKIRTRPQFF